MGFACPVSASYLFFPCVARECHRCCKCVQALLEAEQKGLIPRLEAPIHFHDKDGSVKVPPKWDNILRKSEVYKELSMGGRKTPPLTPPRSPLPGARTPPKSP